MISSLKLLVPLIDSFGIKRRYLRNKSAPILDLHVFISQLFSKYSQSECRPKVLIFGASIGGQSQFDEVKKSHNVIGFLDNNPSKHGRRLKNKTIYSPNNISKLCFDKIIIASCYHHEITQQLIQDFNVSADEISVFHSCVRTEKRFWPKIKQYINQTYFRVILSSLHTSVAEAGFWIARRISRSYDSLSLTSFEWIDKDLGPIECTLRREKQAEIYGPNYLGTVQRKKRVTLPAIYLSRYRHASIHCSSNSVLHDNQLFLWRSPTCEHQFSNYAVGNIFIHGDTFALTTEYDTLKVQKGLAITGSCDVNYYHWILEVLSKLAYLEELNDLYADYPVLMSEKARDMEAVSTFVAQLNLKRNIVYLQSNHHYTVDDLLTITPPNYLATNFKGKTRHEISDSYFRQESLEFIRRTGLSYIKDRELSIPAHKRIFLARKTDKRLYNQDEVWGLLKANGFMAVYFEDMSFGEQVHVMNKARYIVGPTGAAWTNLLFSQPGSEALCWMAEEYGDFSCYSHIAAEMQVKMDYITYKTGSINSAELYYGAYNVDVRQLAIWLEEKQLLKTTCSNSYVNKNSSINF